MTNALKWAALAGGLTAAAGALVWAVVSRRGGEATVTVSAPRKRRRA